MAIAPKDSACCWEPGCPFTNARQQETIVDLPNDEQFFRECAKPHERPRAARSAGVKPVLLAIGLAAGPGLAQTLPQVTVSATRSEASPFDVPAAVDVIDG